MQSKNKNVLFLIVFFAVLFVLKVVLFKDVYLVLSNEGNKFSFSNFLIFNYLFKGLGYFIKIILIFGLFKFSLFVFDVKEQSSILNIVVLAELVKLILIDGLKVIVYYVFNDMTLEAFTNFELNYSITGIFNLQNIGSVKPLLNAVSIFDLIYIVFVIFLFSNFFKMSKIKSFKVVGMPYLLILMLLGLFKIFV